MFTEDQLHELNQPLLDTHVKQRKGQGGRTLDYLEGWYSKQTANRIFGYGLWNHEVLDLIEREDSKGRPIVIATVRVEVFDPTDDTIVAVHEEVGTGNGSKSDDYDGAYKGAVTDALKRALTPFGDQFGLALYDKDRAGVENQSQRSKRVSAGLTGEQSTQLREAAKGLPAKRIKTLYLEATNRDGTLDFDSLLATLKIR